MSAASSARQQDVTLNELVDLALCSPEIGAVNFNILRLVLHELVKIVGNGREILPALGDMDKSQVQNFKNYIMGAGTQTPPIGVLRIAQQPTVFIPAQTPRTGRNPNPQGVNQPVYAQPVQASPPIIPQGQGAVQQAGFPQQQPSENQQGAVQQAGFPQQQPSENQQGAVQQAEFPQQQPSGNQQGAVQQAKVTNQTQRGPGQQGGGGRGKQVQPPTQGQVQPGAPQSHSQAALQPVAVQPQSQGAVQPTASQPQMEGQVQPQPQPQKLGTIQQGQPQPQRSTGQPEQGQVQQAPIVQQQQLTDVPNPPAPIQHFGQIQQGPVLVPAQGQVNQQAAPMSYQPEGLVMYSQPPGAPPAAYTQQGQSYSQPGQSQYTQPAAPAPQVTYTQQGQPVYVGANGYPMNYSPYMQQGAVMPHDQELEAKVTRLERQLEALYALPTNSTILRRVSRDPDEPEGGAPHSTSEAAEGSGMAVNDMWQVIQLNNRVAGCEVTIQKMASLIEDLAKQLRSSKRRSMDTGSDTEGGIYERCDEAQRAVEVLRGEIDEIKKGTVQAVSNMGLQQPSKMPGQASSQASQAQVGPEQLGRMQARLGASEGAIKKMAKEMKTLKQSQAEEQTIGTVKTKCEEVAKAVETLKSDLDEIKQQWKEVKEEFEKLIEDGKGDQDQLPQQPIGSEQDLQIGQVPLIPTKHVDPGRPIPGATSTKNFQASRTQNQVPAPLPPVHHTPSEEMLLRKQKVVAPLTDLDQLLTKLRAEGRIPPFSTFDEVEVSEKVAALWEAAELMRRNQEAVLLKLLKLDNSIQQFPQEHLEALGQIPVEEIERLGTLAGSEPPFPRESVSPNPATTYGRRETEFTKRPHPGVFEIDSDVMNTIIENLNNLVAESIEHKEGLEVMHDLCRHFETIMVTKEVLADALLDKADKQAMNTKVSQDEFENSVEELTNKLQNLLVEVYQKNKGWKRITDELIQDLGEKLSKDELGSLRAYFKSHLENLEKQVEELVRQMNEPDPAGTRKKILRDYNCISCDRHTNISGKTNGPTLPCVGPSLAGYTSGPRRAFDMCNMRNSAKGLEPVGFGSGCRSEGNLMPNGKQYSECVYDTVNRYVGGSHTAVSAANRVSAFKRPGTVLAVPKHCKPKDADGVPQKEVSASTITRGQSHSQRMHGEFGKGEPVAVTTVESGPMSRGSAIQPPKTGNPPSQAEIWNSIQVDE